MLANEVRNVLEDEEDEEKIKSLQSDLEDCKNCRYGFSGRGCTDYSIYEVDEDGKGCKLQQYAAKLVGNYYEQNYIYEDENGKPLLSNHFMTIRYKYKSWRVGHSKVNLRFGYRDEYEDPSF